VPHHHRGQPFIANFDGADFPLEKMAALREELRMQNQTPEGHPTCKGCALLEPELCIAGIAAASRVPEASQAWVEGGVF
jgi:hypothetical protein